MAKQLHDGLNAHLKLEFQAWYDYMAMANWLEGNDLPGMATWVKNQSNDELTHAQKIIDHLLERDLKVELHEVPAPPTEWSSVKAVAEDVLKSEQKVTKSIEALYSRAEEVCDRAAVLMLQWFIHEQMEEENVARALIGRLKLAGDSGIGLLMVDQELSTGTVPGAMPEAE